MKTSFDAFVLHEAFSSSAAITLQQACIQLHPHRLPLGFQLSHVLVSIVSSSCVFNAGDKYELFMVFDLTEEGDDPRGGPRIAFQASSTIQLLSAHARQPHRVHEPAHCRLGKKPRDGAVRFCAAAM